MFRAVSFILSIVFLCSSCTSLLDEQLEYALSTAGDNRMELETVLNHYDDYPQKRKAAKWLIANMPGHTVKWDEAIQAFADSVNYRPLSEDRGNELWDSLQRISNETIECHDIESVSSEYLIDNIDGAFNAWRKSPWRREVDFDLFKKYILPYRVDNELLRIGWRDSLAKNYWPLVLDAKTAQEAFERICRKVKGMRINKLFKFPYLMDAVALRNHVSGLCIERCVYLANVCRAIGLPVVIDNCGKWANYSNKTHTWVALVLNEGTYTIVNDDSIAKKKNIIDSSIFSLDCLPPKNYPYTGEFKKRLVKVWRQTFDLNPLYEMPQFGKYSTPLSSPRFFDVSEEYGITGSVDIKPDIEVDDVWLCTHALEIGWIPQAHAKVNWGSAKFKNISDSVMMLPMGLSMDGKEIPVGHPFYLSKGDKIEIIPDTTKFLITTLTRKYPLVAKWINRYAQIPTTRFEGSNNDKFLNPDTLFTIQEVPLFYNSATINSTKAYRYIRAIADLPSYVNMDCISIYDKEGKFLASNKKWQLDLNAPKKLGRIDYIPWNDGNFVVPGHDYELEYWQYNHWESIERKHSDGYELTFKKIPSNALLILHDHTEGKEERPFTLQNDKQIWW